MKTIFILILLSFVSGCITWGNKSHIRPSLLEQPTPVKPVPTEKGYTPKQLVEMNNAAVRAWCDAVEDLGVIVYQTTQGKLDVITDENYEKRCK